VTDLIAGYLQLPLIAGAIFGLGEDSMKVSLLGLALLSLLAKPAFPAHSLTPAPLDAMIAGSATGILTTISIKAPRSDARRADDSGSTTPQGTTNRAPRTTTPDGPQS